MSIVDRAMVRFGHHVEIVVSRHQSKAVMITLYHYGTGTDGGTSTTVHVHSAASIRELGVVLIRQADALDALATPAKQALS